MKSRRVHLCWAGLLGVVCGLLVRSPSAGADDSNESTIDPKAMLHALAFSPDGKTLAAAGISGFPAFIPVIRVWDTARRKQTLTLLDMGQGKKTLTFLELLEWPNPSRLLGSVFLSVAFSPDGKSLAFGSEDGRLDVWDGVGGTATTLKGHTGAVLSLAFSPDGKTLASAGADQTIRLWDLSSRKNSSPFKGHAGPVVRVIFAADGKTLTSAGADGTIRVWEVASGKNTATSKSPASAAARLALSLDGKTLALGYPKSNSIELWDLATGKKTTTFADQPSGVQALAFSPDGKTLAVGREEEDAARKGSLPKIVILDVATGRKTATLSWPIPDWMEDDFSTITLPVVRKGARQSSRAWDDALETTLGVPGRVAGLAFAADRKTLTSLSRPAEKECQVTATDLDSRKNTTLFRRTVPDKRMAFSPDGKTFASWGGSEFALWNVASGKKTPLEGSPNYFSLLDFTADGKTVVCCERDSTRIWDVATGKLLATRAGHGGLVTCQAVSAGGKRFASGSQTGTIKVWDMETGKVIASLKEGVLPITCMALNADGTILAVGCESLAVWDVAAGKRLDAFSDLDTKLGGKILTVTFSPDGRTVASSCSGDDRTLAVVRLWDLTTGSCIHTFRGLAYSLAFSADGRTLAANGGSIIKVWRATVSATLTRRASLTGHTTAVYSVVFSPDGKTLTSLGQGEMNLLSGGVQRHPRWTLTAAPGMIKVWEVASGKNTATYRNPASADAVYLGLSRDGQTLALGERDGTIRLKAVASGKTTPWKDLPTSPLGACFSPDGSGLVLRDRDGLAWVGMRSTGKITRADFVFKLAAFSPDSQTLVLTQGVSHSAHVTLWDVPGGKVGLAIKVFDAPRESSTLGYRDGSLELSEWPLLPIEAVALSPNGKTLALGYRDGSVQLWEVARGKKTAALKGHLLGVTSMVFSPDGKTLASASADGTIRLWDLALGKTVAAVQAHDGECSCVAFGPDGKTLASGGGDGTVQLWDVGFGTKAPR
jgi:WD40 repeat protein